MKISKYLNLILSSLLLAAPFQLRANETSEDSIVTIAQNAGVFNTLLAAAQAAGVAGWIDNQAPKTVFAPTDEAFAKLPAGTVESLLLPENQQQLIQILHYHLVEGVVKSTDLRNGYVETVARAGLKVNVGATVTLNDTTTVTTADVMAKNGVIHIIDSVLLPPQQTITDQVASDPELSTLLAAVSAAGLGNALATGRPYTVFAPTNDAFAKLPAGTLESLLQPENLSTLQNIMLYHATQDSIFAGGLSDGPIAMLNGGSITVDTSAPAFIFPGGSASPVAIDILANNGVVHKIDTVMLPGGNNLVETLAADGRFTTLLSVATSAGIADTLATLGNATLFAPTDEAFAKLPADILAALTDPANTELLTNVLLYHVVTGNRYAAGLSTGVYPTATGVNLPISVGSGVWVNNQANVVQANILSSQAVIHAIDHVLLPPQNIGTSLRNDGRFSTLVAALEAANLLDVLNGGDKLTLFAPTNEAFGKLPAGTVNTLLQPENLATLTAVLTAHVVPGAVGAGDLLNAPVTTLQGKMLNAHFSHGSLQLDAGPVLIQSDLPAWNGTIHVIDSVILP